LNAFFHLFFLVADDDNSPRTLKKKVPFGSYVAFFFFTPTDVNAFRRAPFFVLSLLLSWPHFENYVA
jgi:hypothetical protein